VRYALLTLVVASTIGSSCAWAQPAPGSVGSSSQRAISRGNDALLQQEQRLQRSEQTQFELNQLRAQAPSSGPIMPPCSSTGMC
jgi:hypothetical protein